MAVGTVKFFNQSKGYGFIAPDGGGQDAFVHVTAVERAGFLGLRENQRISYELERDQRGKSSAVNLGAVEDTKIDESAEISGIAEAAPANDKQPATNG